MPVSFSRLQIGALYERKYLAELWGYKSFNAIARGVVTPAGSNLILLFVTEEKQGSSTQYNDFLLNGKLHWEGEERHGSDRRIIHASYGSDELHLFFRVRHHAPFVYKGRIFLEQHYERRDGPSQFIFYLASTQVSGEGREIYDFSSSESSKPQSTSRRAIEESRRGQGVFRDGLFRLWASCAVTGYERERVLIASHIKPWKYSTDGERLDPYNGLLLQPTIDKLFDFGFVTFTNEGTMIRARSFGASELVRLGIDPRSRLRLVHQPSKKYLEYHRDTRFEHFEGDP